jgi:hypothetical protein
VLNPTEADLAKLKLSPIAEEKPAKVPVELPAALHRDLVAYAEALGRESGQATVDPVRLIVPMLERFIASDWGFAKSRREAPTRVTEATLDKRLG